MFCILNYYLPRVHRDLDHEFAQDDVPNEYILHLKRYLHAHSTKNINTTQQYFSCTCINIPAFFILQFSTAKYNRILLQSMASLVQREGRMRVCAVHYLVKDPAIGCLCEMNTIPHNPHRWVWACPPNQHNGAIHIERCSAPHKSVVVIFATVPTTHFEWAFKS